MTEQDPQLLAEEQDFQIFVMVGSLPEPDEIKQQCEDMGEKNEQHAAWQCRDHAGQGSAKRNQPMEWPV